VLLAILFEKNLSATLTAELTKEQSLFEIVFFTQNFITSFCRFFISPSHCLSVLQSESEMSQKQTKM